MMNISDSMTPEALVAYHKDGHDYYIADNISPSKWGGKLAPEFALVGAVGKAEFKNVCYGRDPITGEKLKPGKAGNRAGYDITFSVPKEVSLAYLRLRQTDSKAAERLLNEFLESTEQSMAEMEKEAATQKKNPKRWEKTGNWLWARYLHLDSRPDEKTGMPVIQIHAHYVVFNLTKADVGMRAIELGHLKSPRSMKATEGSAALHMAEWHSDLARRIKGMGAGIKRTKSISFGIEGISRELVDQWSPRRATIKEAKKRILAAMDDPEKRMELFEKYNIKDWDAFKETVAKRLQGELAKLTRKHKQKDLSRDELWNYWYSQLTNSDKEMLDSIWGKRGWETTAYDALKYSLEHNHHSRSVLSEKQVLIDALRYGVGSVSSKDLKAEYSKLGVLVNKEGQISTQKVLDQEGRIIDFAREGRGTMRPLMGSTTLSGPASPSGRLEKAATLSAEQQAAIRHVWNSADQVILIRGGAGTGKTTMMKTAIAEINKPVAVLAPSASASRDTLRKEGFKDANTVTAFLADEQWQQKVRGGVIWVDEAALLPIMDLDHLVTICNQLNSRLVLQGDPKQHKSVARHGNLFHILREYAGLPMAELKDIKRQKGRYKEAVAAIDKGDILKGHDILTEMGAVKYEDNPQRLIGNIVSDYLRNVGTGGHCLVVAPTHAVGDLITGEIRLRLRKEGKLAHAEKTFKQYRNLGWSDPQKADLEGYDGSEVVQFFRSIGPFKAGEKYTVEDLRAEQQRRNCRHRGPKSTKPVLVPDKFGVYTPGEINLSVGDSIRITAGGKTLDGKQLDNGSIYTIKGFTAKGDIALTNGLTISKSFGHIAHAYTTTSFGAQGKTVDHVLVAMNKKSAPALNAEQFYVSASRGRKSATIYTDMSPVELRALIPRQDTRKSATEVFGRDRHKQWFLNQSRRVQKHLRQMRDRAVTTITKWVIKDRRHGLER